jgi:hypothetical protein
MLSGKFTEGNGEGYADPHHEIWLTLLQAPQPLGFELEIGFSDVDVGSADRVGSPDHQTGELVSDGGFSTRLGPAG